MKQLMEDKYFKYSSEWLRNLRKVRGLIESANWSADEYMKMIENPLSISQKADTLNLSSKHFLS